MIDDAGVKVASDRGEGPDPQPARIGSGGIGDRGGPFGPAVKQRPGDVQQRLPGCGEADLAAVAQEEARAQSGLQALDLLAQRRLRDMQLLGGPGEVQLFGHCDEIPQVPEVNVHNQRLSQAAGADQCPGLGGAEVIRCRAGAGTPGPGGCALPR